MKSYVWCSLALACVLALPGSGVAAEAGKPGAATTITEDMAQFKPLVEAALKAVKSGDFAMAKTKITDLEKAWDDAEKTLKPKYPAEWQVIDKALDKAFTEVRKPKPDAAKCSAALEDVLAKLAKPTK